MICGTYPFWYGNYTHKASTLRTNSFMNPDIPSFLPWQLTQDLLYRGFDVKWAAMFWCLVSSWFLISAKIKHLYSHPDQLAILALALLKTSGIQTAQETPHVSSLKETIKHSTHLDRTTLSSSFSKSHCYSQKENVSVFSFTLEKVQSMYSRDPQSVKMFLSVLECS